MAAAEKEGSSCGDISPEVVEAACLAHDLGHPPFGHAGEYTLDKLALDNSEPEGFEGNAQTLRVLTKLAVRYERAPGLNLTRATLAACLKYPWLRDHHAAKKKSKWGAYKPDFADFKFASDLIQNECQTTEANLMDWADDIAYSVHDLEDFHRCGAIPWRHIMNDGVASIISRAEKNWFGGPNDAATQLASAWDELKAFLDIFEELLFAPYTGERSQRFDLRNMTSLLVGNLIEETGYEAGEVKISSSARLRVRLLKQITRDYIINNPALAAQQRGQKRILKDLFEAILEDSKHRTVPAYLPHRLRYLLGDESASQPRMVCDCIASLTEREATELYARLFGSAYGSVLDPIVR